MHCTSAFPILESRRECGGLEAPGTTSGPRGLAPSLGGALLNSSMVAALTFYAVSSVVGELTILGRRWETKGKPLLETIGD